jgi:hypothetical protein
MHTFATIAVKSDRFISKYIVDQLVHCWFFERAAFATVALESRRPFNLLNQEIVDVCHRFTKNQNDPSILLILYRHALTDTSVFSAQESIGNTGTFNRLALVIRPICVCKAAEVLDSRTSNSPRGVKQTLTSTTLAFPTATIELAVETLYGVDPELERTCPIDVIGAGSLRLHILAERSKQRVTVIL